MADLKIQCGERIILNSIYDGAYDDWTTNKSLQTICNLALYTEGGGNGTKLKVMTHQQLSTSRDSHMRTFIGPEKTATPVIQHVSTSDL